MKRCPKCNRVESDDALAFCRMDGTALISDSGSGRDANTEKFGSAPVSSEVETTLLPQGTHAGISRTPRTVLPAVPAPGPSHELARPKRTQLVITLGTLAAVIIVFGGYLFFARNRASTIESIAVLPFQNKSNDADSDYLSDGLAESLIYRLSQLPNLKVSPTSSVFRYTGKEIDPIKVGNELGVNAVMSGRFVQRGDNLTISVELVDVRNNKLIWGEQYERKTSDLLATQREIAREIAQNLKLRVSGQENGLTKQYTESNEAYQFYLKGRFYWNKRTGENLQKAIEQFQQAVERDPTFALAYVGLSDCYVLLEQYAGAPSSETLPKAKTAADRALQIDDSLAEAHTSLGYVNWYSWHFEEAEKEYKRAIVLNPNYPTAHHWYSVYLLSIGRMDEAMAEMKFAQQLDPLSPMIGSNVGLLYIFKGDLNTAIEENKKVLEFYPNFPRAHDDLGYVYVKQGREQEAIAELQKAVDESGRASEELAYLGYGYGASGKRAEAMAVLSELQQRYAKRESPAVNLAAVCAGVGDKDQAFGWLERDFQARTGLLLFITILPDYDTLRGDARYTDLLRRIGLRQ